MEVIKKVAGNISLIDENFVKKTQVKLDNLTKPRGSLGRLEELAKQICGITGKESPLLRNKVIFTLAADHGVVREGVSAYPQEVTAQMVYNFLSGGAGINVLANHVGARVVIVDIGVAVDLKPDPRLVIKKINYGTKNMVKGQAMTRAEAIKAIRAGIEMFEDEFKRGIDIAGTGDMGIGNTTAASAVTACFTKKPIEEITGRGAGLDDKGLKNKIDIIKKSISINKPDPSDPIDVLSKVGGFEIGGLAGIILAAASRKVPVVIDGFISGAAALVAFYIEPRVKDYMIPAHCSVEKGHKVILEHIGLEPLLDLDLRLGEGTGGALAIGLADAAIKILTQMATFKSANISERKQ
ncbi:MAG: nicotinate-nucleotide--dimethylbenzimidazole phosphoribosyltransferase [Candidatus Omnitrophica bacterium CG07_land_8_20_14_0_80_42_15]|uniref:Nicotinate-nucleotide--dimethylbenzimidazole phosphoribosyltransferase n=1 Tax=Candidatus Aquitaenariimonas noxiae TaxID=1974741 RepID=A0A2J0KSY8_9BACT|nr:MAG: nicotinate-nucleotide--dimethylbenzimidazole phosphoribosyltransferase [Candidatus Omnitrophica bacterium CG07_land_8_20_14_0_80_42_15]